MAEGIFNKIVLWTLLIVFMLIFIFAMYGKDKGFISRIAGTALSIGEKFLPFQASKEQKHDETVPVAVVNAQKSVIGTIDSAKNAQSAQNACRVNMPALSGLNVEFANDNGNINVKIIKEVRGKGLFSNWGAPDGYAYLNKETIQNANLCVIKPVEFYSCYIDSKKECSASSYSPIGVVRIINNKATIGGASYDLANTKENGILFIKFDKNNFCFVPTYPGWFTRFGCDAEKLALDDDCTEKIVNVINKC